MVEARCPELRIVPQDLWEKVQAHIARMLKAFGTSEVVEKEKDHAVLAQRDPGYFQMVAGDRSNLKVPFRIKYLQSR